MFDLSLAGYHSNMVDRMQFSISVAISLQTYFLICLFLFYLGFFIISHKGGMTCVNISVYFLFYFRILYRFIYLFLV